MSDKQKINVAWISGSYHKAKALFEKVKETFKAVECCECTDDTPYENLYNNLHCNQCFSTSRMITMFGIPKMTETEKKKFRATLEKLPDDIFIVFFMISPSDEKAIFNTVEKIGKVYHFDETVPIKESSEYIHHRSRELGITLEASAAEGLAENCGLDSGGKAISIDIIEMSLQRLMLFAPERTNYTLADVVATSVFYENFVIWDLLNACDEKNYEKCQNMLAKATSLSDNEVIGIGLMMGTMLWKYRLLLFLRERTANKIDKKQISAEASSLRKITYEGQGFEAKPKFDTIATGPNAGKPATIWTANVVMGALEGFYGRKPTIDLYSRKELYLIVKALDDASILLRGCQSDAEAQLIADTVLMTICSVMDTKDISRIQNSLIRSRV